MEVPTNTLTAAFGENGTEGVKVTTLLGPPTPEESVRVPERLPPLAIEKVVAVTLVGSRLWEKETTIGAFKATLLWPLAGEVAKMIGCGAVFPVEPDSEMVLLPSNPVRFPASSTSTT